MIESITPEILQEDLGRPYNHKIMDPSIHETIDESIFQNGHNSNK
jgi:hypothetical protein